MSSQITGLAQAQRNANDGISVAQTAEGALNQVNDNLQRIRELAVQAQNDTNSKEDRESIQAEIDQRLTEIDRISSETNFNGVKVLSENQTINIQVGANDNEKIGVELQKIDKTTLGLASFDVTKNVSAQPQLGEQAGYNDTLGTVYKVINEATGEAYDDLYAAKAEDGSLVAVKKLADTDATAANGGFQAVTYQDGTSGAVKNATLTYTANDAAGNDYSKNALIIAGVKNDGDTVDTGIALTGAADGAVTDINSMPAVDLAKGGLAQLDSALATVDSLRSDLGAIQNRFESAITNLSTNETNLAAARSRIEDADYAVEVANMTRAQILQQAGTSVLAQANQIPQNVLSLLG